MNWKAMIAVSWLVTVATCIAAQTNAPVAKVTVHEAAGDASALSLRMPEDEADQVLSRHGLVWSGSAGCSDGWTRMYPLTNGAALLLDIEPIRVRRDGVREDGLLKAAYIQSNSVKIATIELRASGQIDPSYSVYLPVSQYGMNSLASEYLKTNEASGWKPVETRQSAAPPPSAPKAGASEGGR